MNSNLKMLLDENNVNLSEFCKDVGISRQYLYMLMNDGCNPSISVANRIASKLDVNIKDIWL